MGFTEQYIMKTPKEWLTALSDAGEGHTITCVCERCKNGRELFLVESDILQIQSNAQHDLLVKLSNAENAISQCLAWANGRQYEWGERAENAFQFLENYMLHYPVEPNKESYEYYPLDKANINVMLD
jgi:queuine/archaeosine tRNA-ribosyltransferase